MMGFWRRFKRNQKHVLALSDKRSNLKFFKTLKIVVLPGYFQLSDKFREEVVGSFWFELWQIA